MRYVWKVFRSSIFPLFVVILSLAAQFVLPLLNFPSRIEDISSHVFLITLIVGTCWIAFIAAREGRDTLYHLYETTDNIRQRRLRTQIDFMYRFVAIVIVFTGFSVVLLTFSGARRIGASLIASAGVASIVLGFAAQRSLSNLIAGFQIAFTQPMRLDDVVIVENEWGRIEEITLTYVVIALWDLRRMVVPITYFIEKPFQNWSRKSEALLGYIFLYLDYQFPIDVLRTELNVAIQESPLWDKKVCVLQLTDFSERAMQIRILVSARNAGDAFDLRCFLRERLIRFIKEKYPASLPLLRVEMKT